MGLSDKKRQFFQIRSKCEIVVSDHAFKDYPERGFTANEIINLIRLKTGRISENKSADAIAGSFLFFVMDDLERECKFVLLIEEVVIEDYETGITRIETVIVCSAYRDTKQKKKKS